MWDLGGLAVLIPKKNGKGYLKTPLYHNYVKALSDIESDECVNLCGLDGYLHLDYGYTDTARREAIEARVMPRLAAHYGFTTWKEDSVTFWEILLPNVLALARAGAEISTEATDSQSKDEP